MHAWCKGSGPPKFGILLAMMQVVGHHATELLYRAMVVICCKIANCSLKAVNGTQLIRLDYFLFKGAVLRNNVSFCNMLLRSAVLFSGPPQNQQIRETG
jgi:hypothetical protein